MFDHGAFTPNDAFFVRYHLAGAPPRGLDAATHRLQDRRARWRGRWTSASPTCGATSRWSQLAAVNECSGNGRGFSSPRVAGGQLGNGHDGQRRCGAGSR